jgi:hypothetical protein
MHQGNPAMKDDYDFANAERGKFFRRDTRLIPLAHLDPETPSVEPGKSLSLRDDKTS